MQRERKGRQEALDEEHDRSRNIRIRIANPGMLGVQWNGENVFSGL